MVYKWLQQQWETLFPALERAETENDVQRICESAIAEWRARPGMKQESSLRVPMTDTRNALKLRLQGERQTWALKYLAFSEGWYIEHNANSQSSLQTRLEHQQLLKDPDAIVAEGTKLLASDQWADIAVGLAVCTGRRLAEVLKVGQFEYKTVYSVMFHGQLKRREAELPPFEIPTLCRADAVIEAVSRLRSVLNVTELDTREVSQRYGSVVQDSANKHFATLVPAREGKTDLYSHLFRSVYARIAVFYYCPPIIADIHFMATVQGHYQFLEAESDELRRSYASNAHYFDYKIADASGNIDGRQGIKLGSKDVELLEVFKPKPRKEKKPMTTETQENQATAAKQKGKNYPVTVKEPTYNRVVALRSKLGQGIYDETIAYLLDAYEQQGSRAKLDELTPEDLVSAETAATIHDAMQISKEENFRAFLNDALTKEARFRLSLSKRHADKDFSKLSNSELTNTKHPDATKERIRRAIAAIAKYNDEAQSANDRWYINPTIIHKLVGGRFPIINEYFEEHKSEIDAENAEHELTPAYNRKPTEIKNVVTVSNE